MALFLIRDGRSALWQWDTGRKLTVTDPACMQVHFGGAATEDAFVCDVYEQSGERVADIPNTLLQTDDPIRAYCYLADADGGYTEIAESFYVMPRAKPQDYIYTQTEAWTAEKAVEEALQEAKDSGAFKGDPGPKGDPGVVKFVVVTKLPEEGDGDTIYLLPRTAAVATLSVESNPAIKGVWVFNEINSFSYVPANVSVNFTSNGVAYIGMTCNVNPIEYVRNWETNETDSAHNGAGWADEAYRTVDFGETEQEVDAEFYNWVTSYAVASGETDTDTDTSGDNLFDEYIFVEGVWEKLGSTAVSVNLGEYVKSVNGFTPDINGNVEFDCVKSTDYGSNTKPGLVKGSAVHGTYVNETNGLLSIVNADKNHINNRVGYIPITPQILDYAIKAGLTTNTQALTEEEKAAACAWLGVPGIIANGDGTLTILLADGSKYTVNAEKEET